MVDSGDDETVWIDAWIRWDRNSKETYINGNEEEDVEEAAKAPPTDTFRFRYTTSPSRRKIQRDLEEIIELELKGFDADSEQIWNSTGLTIWRSSEQLCEVLLHREDLGSRHLRILELGSGLGRCGLLAHHLSPDSLVYLTDGDSDTLRQLRQNVKVNQLERCKENLKCYQLLWGKSTAQSFVERHLKGGEKVDLILGSDLVYVPSVITPLFETVSELLDGSGEFIMSHCSRREGSSVTLEMVLERAAELGLKHTIMEEDDDISVISFRWK